MVSRSSAVADIAAAAPSVRVRIQKAAQTEFADHGLRGSSLRSIAARAGVTAAMVNYYYGSKRALYDLVVEEAQARLSARLSEGLATGGHEELPARLIASYFDFLSGEQEFQRLILREVLDRGGTISEFVRKYLAPLRGLLEELFGGDEQAVQTAISLFGAVAGYFIYEPVFSELLGGDALAAERLEKRRDHLMALASLLARSRT